MGGYKPDGIRSAISSLVGTYNLMNIPRIYVALKITLTHTFDDIDILQVHGLTTKASGHYGLQIRCVTCSGP